MDIHKPKPWHGVREFLKEYAIIVLGVLTALAGEQVAEALHHRELVRTAEDSLRDNFIRFLEYKGRLEVENACMRDRAAELRAVLDHASETGRLPGIGAIPQPVPHPWQIDTWDAMMASQVAPYIRHDRLVLYSRVAMSAVDLYVDGTAEWSEWGALKSLSGPARPFRDAEQARARETLARAVSQAELVEFIAANTVPRIEATGLLTAQEQARALAQGRQADRPPMCRPIAQGEG